VDLTWDELVELEPCLRLIEYKMLKVQDRPDRPYFCALDYWMGDRGFARELASLVGENRHEVSPVTDWNEGGKDDERVELERALAEVDIGQEDYLDLYARVREQDEREGRGLLWTLDAWIVASDHVYGLLPDCRHDWWCERS